MKKIISLLLILSLTITLFAFSSCRDNNDVDSNDNDNSVSVSSDYPTAEIKVKDFGTIIVELYYDKAPNTVSNFVSLANSSFYNGLIFHRIINGFMIQGGSPDGTASGSPDYKIAGEFSANGFNKNDISHKRGVISMARASAYDSAESQFFICHQDSSRLDGEYAAFGAVIEGMDVVDKIAAVTTDLNDKPFDNVVIESITVDLNGINIEEPVTIVN